MSAPITAELIVFMTKVSVVNIMVEASATTKLYIMFAWASQTESVADERVSLIDFGEYDRCYIAFVT